MAVEPSGRTNEEKEDETMTNKEIKKEQRQKMYEAGYFFHPGGDMHGEMGSPKTRGIWRRVESPLKAVWVGNSWAEAWENYQKHEWN